MGQLFGTGAVADIDDSRTRHPAADGQQLAVFVLGPADDIGQVGAFEASFEQVAPFESQSVLDIVRHRRRSRGRKGDDRSVHQFPQFADAQVVRPEIIAPLGDAMCLVHHDIADVHHLQVGAEQAGAEPFGRQVEELEVAVGGVVQRQVHLVPVHAGIDAQGLDTPVVQLLDLVLHERDERGDHEGDPLLHQRGHLETHGLPAAGGQDREDIPAGHRLPDDVFLHGTEGLIPPIRPQNVQRFHEFLQKFWSKSF